MALTPHTSMQAWLSRFARVRARRQDTKSGKVQPVRQICVSQVRTKQARNAPGSQANLPSIEQFNVIAFAFDDISTSPSGALEHVVMSEVRSCMSSSS